MAANSMMSNQEDRLHDDLEEEVTSSDYDSEIEEIVEGEDDFQTAEGGGNLPLPTHLFDYVPCSTCMEPFTCLPDLTEAQGTEEPQDEGNAIFHVDQEWAQNQPDVQDEQQEEHMAERNFRVLPPGGIELIVCSKCHNVAHKKCWETFNKNKSTQKCVMNCGGRRFHTLKLDNPLDWKSVQQKLPLINARRSTVALTAMDFVEKQRKVYRAARKLDGSALQRKSWQTRQLSSLVSMFKEKDERQIALVSAQLNTVKRIEQLVGQSSNSEKGNEGEQSVGEVDGQVADGGEQRDAAAEGGEERPSAAPANPAGPAEEKDNRLSSFPIPKDIKLVDPFDSALLHSSRAASAASAASCQLIFPLDTCNVGARSQFVKPNDESGEKLKTSFLRNLSSTAVMYSVHVDRALQKEEAALTDSLVNLTQRHERLQQKNALRKEALEQVEVFAAEQAREGGCVTTAMLQRAAATIAPRPPSPVPAKKPVVEQNLPAREEVKAKKRKVRKPEKPPQHIPAQQTETAAEPLAVGAASESAPQEQKEEVARKTVSNLAGRSSLFARAHERQKRGREDE